MKLTPEQAIQDALTVLKAAGFGKEHKRPAAVECWSLGRGNFGMGPEEIRTRVKVRSADLDDAVRTLIVLPGTVACSITATAVVADRMPSRIDSP